MKVYLFGNQDVAEDNLAFQVAEKLHYKMKGLEFVTINPNEDLPFVNKPDVVLIDTVQGIDKVEIINENDLNHLSLAPRTTVHDFDLGFQLKYLKKLKKLGKVKIIGLPQNKKINYDLLISIFKKLVAQDIQGS